MSSYKWTHFHPQQVATNQDWDKYRQSHDNYKNLKNTKNIAKATAALFFKLKITHHPTKEGPVHIIFWSYK